MESYNRNTILTKILSKIEEKIQDIKINLIFGVYNIKKYFITFLKKVSLQLVMNIIIIFGVGSILIVFINGFGPTVSAVGNFFFPGSSRIVEVKNLVIGGLQDRQELTTVSVSTKATVHTSQDKKLSRLSLGNTHVVYEAIGEVQAGIDIKDLKVKNTNSKNLKIEVLLPPPHLTNAFLKINDSQVVVKYKKWFGPSVESDLQDQAQKQALKIIKEEACEEQILEKANQNAQIIVEEFLTKANYKDVIVKTQPGTCST